jgi:hypothetical protein
LILESGRRKAAARKQQHESNSRKTAAEGKQQQETAGEVVRKNAACLIFPIHTFSPVHSARKFSAVLGTTSAYSSNVTRPTGLPLMSISNQKTSGFFIDMALLAKRALPDGLKLGLTRAETIDIIVRKIDKMSKACMLLLL